METLTVNDLHNTNVKIGSTWYHVTDQGKWIPGKQSPKKIIVARSGLLKPILKGLAVIAAFIIVSHVTKN